MVEFHLHGAQADLDIPQALPVGESGEGHTEGLIEARVRAHAVVAFPEVSGIHHYYERVAA